jgi:putative aldouronate transport system permease protein
MQITKPRHSIRRSRSDLIFDIVVLIIMALVMIVCIYPLYFILIASVSDPNYVLTGQVILFPKGLNFEGYARILGEQKIWTGYRNTIVYTVVGTALNVALTVTAGYALSRKDMPGRKGILLVIIFTMFFNGGMIPTYMVVKNLHLIDTIWAMILPSAVQVWNLMIARSFFETTIPGELLDASMIDGCRTLQFFFRIVLPVSKAIIAVLVLFYAISHWNAFFNALIYLETESKYPLQIILRNILIQNQPDAAMIDDMATLVERQKIAEMIKYGVIVVASAPVLILYPFVQKYFVTGIMVGSIKG